MSETKKTKIEIKKLLIQIGDKELRLTVNEAKELHKILGELVAEKVPTVIIEKDIIINPISIPWYPVYPYYPAATPYPDWTITCGDVNINTLEDGHTNITCGTLYLSTNGIGGDGC